MIWGQGPEANAPSFEKDNADWAHRVGVDFFPLGFGDTVALAAEGGFVVLWNLGGFVLLQRLEYL